MGMLVASAVAQDEDSYSPYAGQNYPANVYFGDMHLHTNMSVDAYGMGNTILSPEDAYRFAKGDAVMSHNGQMARLSRPLDFLAVTDHGFNMGVLNRILSGDPMIAHKPAGRMLLEKLRKYAINIEDIINAKSNKPMDDMWDALYTFKAFSKAEGRAFFWQLDYIKDAKLQQSIWDEVVANADRHNNPGQFTAFAGYEWTALYRHRNVIFDGGMGQSNQVIPFTKGDSENVEDLWDYMENYEKNSGGRVMAIPHNGNLSQGQMFKLTDYQGQPIDRAFAQTRSRWEPLYEVTQIKGDGETHPLLSPSDEFADFETLNKHSGDAAGHNIDLTAQKKASYARSTLMTGLAQKVKLGINPFKFGLIGSTDAHTSLASGEENNFLGKHGLFAPGPHRIKTLSNYGSGGYAAVWATENTRESLFSAMKRKETYATTGPRMTVRFFGGWDYDKADASRPDLARIGYGSGVPMGGDLTHAPKGQAPRFLIRAVKDPNGANLDRVQVVKGWHDRQGELHEKVYNVALSDGRKDRGQKTEKVGSTVDVKDASYTNSIGAPELATVWTDPDFRADAPAFYYVRVLEIPTPRWTAYDAKFFKIRNIPEDVPMVIQERAYTSPIWYTP